MERMSMSELLRNAPKNWGRWGVRDETGSLNFLDAAEVLRGLHSVVDGTVLTLGLPIGRLEGDPVGPGRIPTIRHNTQDRSSYLTNRVNPLPGGVEWADDLMVMYLQGTTHVDALAHVWYDGEIYNGESADTTVDFLSRSSVLPIASKGIVGRALLLDLARYFGKERLQPGDRFALDDLLATAKAQKTEIRKHDILLIRTGWLSLFYEEGPAAFYGGLDQEPGLAYTPELPQWFYEMEIPALLSDTINNEIPFDESTQMSSVLHACLMRDLGVVFGELFWLDDLARACHADSRYDCFFVAGPLKVAGATGGPLNPVVIR